MYEEICKANRGLLANLARRYAGVCALDRAVSVEDLIQAGYLGLMRAADSFDAGSGKTWAGWASWHIRREFDRALGLRDGRFTRPDAQAEPLDRPLSADRGGATAGDLLADERLPDPDAALLREELCRGVREAVERLPDERQRRVVRRFKLEGLSYGEVASEIGVSVPQAHRLYARASENLARDARLRALADLDARTRFHAHKGVAAFNRDWTSVTESAALWRIGQRERAANP